MDLEQRKSVWTTNFLGEEERGREKKGGQKEKKVVRKEEESILAHWHQQNIYITKAISM